MKSQELTEKDEVKRLIKDAIALTILEQLSNLEKETPNDIEFGKEVRKKLLHFKRLNLI